MVGSRLIDEMVESVALGCREVYVQGIGCCFEPLEKRRKRQNSKNRNASLREMLKNSTKIRKKLLCHGRDKIACVASHNMVV